MPSGTPFHPVPEKFRRSAQSRIEQIKKRKEWNKPVEQPQVVQPIQDNEEIKESTSVPQTSSYVENENGNQDQENQEAYDDGGQTQILNYVPNRPSAMFERKE